MQKIYFISGLGADERVFQYLKLPGIEQVHLSWLPPLKNETIESYAQRMSERITEPNAIVLGLSFGGMLAMEIAKLRPLKKIFLVSSCKTYKELPPYFRLGRILPLHRLFPAKLLSKSEWLLGIVMGATSPMHKKIMMELLRDNVPGFNDWAVNTVIHWKNTIVAADVVHIHGNKDNMLPLRYVKADYVIDGGTHFMIATKARAISKIVLDELKDILPD